MENLVSTTQSNIQLGDFGVSQIGDAALWQGLCALTLLIPVP